MPDKPTAPSEPTEELRRRGALVLRTLPLLLLPALLFLVAGLVFQLTVGMPPPDRGEPDIPAFAPIIPIAVTAIFSIAVITLVRLRQPTLSALLLIATWTLITTLATLRSGVTDIFAAMLIVPICAAGLLFDRGAALSLAALSSLLVISVGVMQATGLFVPGPPFDGSTPPLAPAVAFWVALFWTVAALTAQLAGGLQAALRRARAHAAELAELSGELEARVAAQTTRLLAQAEEQATLEERTRLAREIHDTLAQGLTGVVVQLGAAERALATSASAADEPRLAELRTNLDLAQRLARETLAEARRSVWNLRAPALERGDLGDALSQLAARPPLSATPVAFAQHGEPWPLPPRVESALLRVAQEALANAARHADAQTVQLDLRYTPDAVTLHIHDDGRGFPPDLLGTLDGRGGPWGGFGLRGMRERLEALGGALELANADGACVRAQVPRAT